MHGDSLAARIVEMATAIRGTEAVAFVVEDPCDELRAVIHIRPVNSSPQTRDAAVAAFREIVGPCVAAQKDGVIQVEDPESGIDLQYCIVTLVRDNAQVSGAVAIITRCVNEEMATRRLEAARSVAAVA